MAIDHKLVNSKLELAKLQKLYAVQLNSAYSSDDLLSRPTGAQKEFLEDINKYLIRWAVCDNQSGKSAAGAREVAWLFANNHPFFSRPAAWGDGPILILILGKKSEQMETALWEKKIKPLLGYANVKEVRSGNALQKVINLDNGNMIIFQSHNNPQEARKNIQGYTAHYVWCDEMPESHSLISELVMRIAVNSGRLVGTFTPLVHNIKIRQIVDGAEEPIAKRYHFSIYDNPSIQDRIAEIIESIRQNCATEMEFRCRVGGEWMAAGKQVSSFDPYKHKTLLPAHYSVQWNHIAVVDPSASGMTGLSVWAEDPKCGVWYNVKATYLQGEAAFDLVKNVEGELAGYNIILRVCDPNPAGFWKEAARIGLKYRCVSDKKDRKLELIDGSNKALITGKMFLTEFSSTLEDELVAAAWREDAEGRIINASSYHCFDTFQYAADNLPKWEPNTWVGLTPDQAFKKQWAQEKAAKAKKIEQEKYRVAVKANRRMRNDRIARTRARAAGR